MSDFGFLAPARLWLLIVPVALALGYAMMQRQRHRYALRFTTLDLLDEVAPDQPGWRRHLPAIGLLLAVIIATIGFARPVVAGESTEAQQLVILAIDMSLSMDAEDVTPTRMEAARESATAFLDTVPDGVAVGVVGFDSRARLLISPTTRLDAVRRTIERDADLGEGTAIGEAVFLALDAIEDAAVRAENEQTDSAKPVGTVVLLSDGDTTSGRSNDEAASEARDRNVPVHTIAFGTRAGFIDDPFNGRIPVPVNEQALEQLAFQTDGQSLTAATAEQLNQVYEDLGRSVQVESVRTEVADWFAGIAVVLLGLAGAASLAWFGRLP
ncbi:MAG: VWA domain-containing protein [bacterium]|nr:VWA domain-containing protein [bacterium]